MATKAFEPKLRSGRWVELVPVLPVHLDFLYRLATDDRVGPRWRFGGMVPGIESFQQGLTSAVLVHFIVQAKSENVLLGHVVAYGADLNSGYTYIGGVMDDQALGTGIAIEAFEVFTDYLFGTYSIRKIYMDIPEYNLPQFWHGYRDVLKTEGRLLNHTYYDGQYWDRITAAVYRDEYLSDARIARRRNNRLQFLSSISSIGGLASI